MSTTTVANRVTRLRLIAAASAALAAAAAVPAGASAVTWHSAGSFGSVGLPAATASYSGFATGRLVANGRIVNEAPAYARSAQQVCMTSRLWSLQDHGSGVQRWQLENRQTNCSTIPAAATRAFVYGVTFDDLMPYQAYGVDMIVRWYLPNGAQVGRTTLDYDLAADYQCTTFKCVKGVSRYGAYVMFDF